MSSTQRTGLTTLRNLAYGLCQAIAKFTPIIVRVFPDATDLHNALELANTACALVVLEADEELGQGI